MLKSVKFATLVVLGALAANPAFAEDKSAALVNGVSIPQARIDLRVKIATAQGQPDSPELRKAIREDMINLEVLAQEARKNGLDKDPEVMLQAEFAQLSVLGGAYVQDYARKHPIGDEQLTKEYDRLKSTLGSNEYEARHILVETQDEAKSIIAQLGKKGKFDKIAKEKSMDVGSAERGGSLGWAVPSNFVQPFADAILALKKGEYTKEPVQTQYGWHVIKLDDVRPLKVPSFDELKPQIQQRLQQQFIQDLLADLRSKAKIE
ncbi:MAG: peptidylprolyl isomerase [Nitrosomonadales bacterium]|nr:peptidylprolyl isomerase [Nitrosomonadales bacterium]